MRFEEQMKEAKEREAYISFELYRLLKDTISRGLVYQETKCEFKEVIPEFPIGGKRSDLIVFTSKYGRPTQPFLVVEVKKRVFSRQGPSMASAVRRVRSYVIELGARVTPFFIVYDGWKLLAFKNNYPYLIGVYGPIQDEYHAKNLLLGLEELSYSNKREHLDKLPGYVDPNFLLKKIFPSVVKEFTIDPDEVKRLSKSWENIIKTFLDLA